jgi:hypothetical protein
MDWMMAIAPIIHTKIPSRERVDALKALAERIKGEETPEERAALAGDVAGHVTRFGSAAKDFYAAWFDAKYAAAGSAGTDALRFALLSDMSERPWARVCSYKQKGKLQRDSRDLRKDKAVKREYAARKMFGALQRTEKQYFVEGATHAKLRELARVYREFAAKYEGTVAAGRALKVAGFYR